MAGPDSKRLYLAIIAQNLDNIKSERAYWNKNFVPVTPSGAGTKYTTLQAAMLLKKMHVVKFLARHPSIDISVKATDGRTTLMIAAQSSMPVTILQKILEKYDLKTINECDPMGKTALDLAQPDTETYEFLESVGCQTKAARDACLQGFFVSAGKHVVHQRVRKKSEAEGAKSNSCPPAEGDRDGSVKQDAPRSCRSEAGDGLEGNCSEGNGSAADDFDDGGAVDDDADLEEEESPWQLFKNPEDLLRVLQNYVDTWGDEGEEGEMCREWIVYLKKKMKKKAASESVTKWNDLVISLYGKENVTEYKGKKGSDWRESSELEGPGAGGEVEAGEEPTTSSKEPPGDDQQKNGKDGGPEPDKPQRGDGFGDDSMSRSGSLSAAKGEKRSESATPLGKQDREVAADSSAKVEKNADQRGKTDGDTSIARSMTVPESLRGFFNPQCLTESSADPTEPKSVTDSERRRTLGVWIDKAEARERFAEVLPKSGTGDSRRRHKKGSKT